MKHFSSFVGYLLFLHTSIKWNCTGLLYRVSWWRCRFSCTRYEVSCLHFFDKLCKLLQIQHSLFVFVYSFEYYLKVFQIIVLFSLGLCQKMLDCLCQQVFVLGIVHVLKHLFVKYIYLFVLGTLWQTVSDQGFCSSWSLASLWTQLAVSVSSWACHRWFCFWGRRSVPWNL